MRKWILRVLLLILVLVIAGAALAVVFVDDLAKLGVERGGSYALGVETRVEKVDVDLFGGDVEIRELFVANPQGYESPYLLKTGTFNLSMNMPTALSNVVEMRSFELDGLDLHIEQRLLRSNIGKVLSNIRRHKRDDDDDDDDDDGRGRRVLIRRLVIRNVSATVYFRGIEGAERTLGVTIPAIELTDVMSDRVGGTITGELFDLLLPIIVKHVLTEGGDLIPPGVAQALSGELGDLVDELRGALEGVLGPFGN